MNIRGNDVTAISASLIIFVLLRVSQQTTRSNITKHNSLGAVAKFESYSIIVKTDGNKDGLRKLVLLLLEILHWLHQTLFSKIKQKFEKKYDKHKLIDADFNYRSVYVHFLGLLDL